MDFRAKNSSPTFKSSSSLFSTSILESILLSLKEQQNQGITRTPVAIFNEICAKSKIEIPKFHAIRDYISNDPQSNFKVECAFCSLKACGFGSNQQQAKHNSALEMLRNVEETLRESSYKSDIIDGSDYLRQIMYFV